MAKPLMFTSPRILCSGPKGTATFFKKAYTPAGFDLTTFSSNSRQRQYHYIDHLSDKQHKFGMTKTVQTLKTFEIFIEGSGFIIDA
jgi:hypothetical protein